MKNLHKPFSVSTRYNGILAAIFILLLISVTGVHAVQPPNPITTTITVDGTETWTNDIVFDEFGEVVVNGDLTLSGIKITTSPRHMGGQVNRIFTVHDHGNLTFNNGTLFDLSNPDGWDNFFPIAIDAMNDSLVTIDNSEISGADVRSMFPVLIEIRDGSEMRLINNAVIRNNKFQNVNSHIAGSSIILISEGKLTVDNAVIADNEIKTYQDADSGFTPKGVIASSRGDIRLNGLNFSNNKTLYTGTIYAVQTKSLEVNDSIFSDNTSSTNAAVFYLSESSLNINGGTEFKNNSSLRGSAVYSTDKSTVQITGENNSFTGNSSTEGGAIYADENSEITISDGCLFRENIRQKFGGAIFLRQGKLSINDAVFEKNTASDSGGALYIHQSDISIRDTVFSENYTGTDGGAIYLKEGNISLDGANLFENNSANVNGGAIQAEYISVMTLNGNNTFRSNDAYVYGGAIMVTADTLYLNGGTFEGNSSYYGGGAILTTDTNVITGRIAIFNNHASELGGGILCGDTEIYIHERNGAAIFDNKADHDKTIVLQDIFVAEEKLDEKNIFSERMFNGGTHHWTFLKKAINDNPVFDGDGVFIGSNPSNRDISDALVIMRDNLSIRNRDIDEALAGALGMTGGTLTIGEEAAPAITIRKVWEGDEASPASRPSIQDLLNGLRLTADGSPYPLGSAKLLEKESLNDGGTRFLFNYSEDPSVSVTIIDQGGNTWELLMEGLPKYINGTEPVYSISEALFTGYRSTVEGGMTEGFVITNQFDAPIPTAVPEPTPVPADGMDFYRLSDRLEKLPETGFPAEKK